MIFEVQLPEIFPFLGITCGCHSLSYAVAESFFRSPMTFIEKQFISHTQVLGIRYTHPSECLTLISQSPFWIYIPQKKFNICDIGT